MSSSSSEQQDRKTVAMAWSPLNPAALVLPKAVPVPATATTDSNERINALQINTMMSHSGVSCNEHEMTALMQLLDSYEIHSQLSPSQRSNWDALKTLSKSYRGALRECLSRWEESLLELEEQNNTMMNDNDNDDASANNTENLELLKIIYSMTHLSEIFLVPPPPEISTSLDYVIGEDIFALPGAFTAETVRYLRYHHATTPDQSVDPDVLQELTDSLHPDQIDGGKPYWDFVTALVKQGQLELAWSFLSRHSLCQRALDAKRRRLDMTTMNPDDYEARMLQQDYEGFEDLRRIFLSAPLPGGRNAANDTGLDVTVEEEPSYKEVVLLEGVEPSAYKLWETSKATMEGRDYPIAYNPRAIFTKRDSWKQYLYELESVQKLRNRIPQLESILQILGGNLKGQLFDSWAEALLAELIYVSPEVYPKYIHARADKLMKKYSSSSSAAAKELDNAILTIMQGDAGEVQLVFFAYGGASGAALTATMQSLLCNLYVDNRIPLPKPFQMELLKSAAFAISSSLAGPNNSDIGARLAVRLLLPFAKPKGDVSIVATIADTLERHTPGSDVEARNLITLCQPLTDKKSERVVEACVSLALCRYRSHLKDDRPGGALHWLLVGLELESKLCRDKDGEVSDWQSIEAVSVCYRYLVSWCVRVSGALLLGILEEREGIAMVAATASAMVESLKEGPLEGYVSKLLEIQTLELMLGIYQGMVGDSSDWTPVATNIKLLLEEKENLNDGGVVTTTAPRCLYYGLLLLGHRVIEKDEQRILTAEKDDYCSSFDVQGVQVLLEQLSTIPLSLELEKLTPVPEELMEKIRLSLAKALSRAFVKENARRKPGWSEKEDEINIAKIKSCDLHKYSIDVQERVVQFMLDY